MKFIKNISLTTIILQGNSINPGVYFQIPDLTLDLWVNDINVLTAIVNEEAVMASANDGLHDFINISSSIKFLKSTSIFIKNNSIDQIVLLGAAIDPGEYYEIKPHEIDLWFSNSKVLKAIITTSAFIAKADNGDEDILDPLAGLNELISHDTGVVNV